MGNPSSLNPEVLDVKELKEIRPWTLAWGVMSAMGRFNQWKKRFREENGRKRKRSSNANTSQEEQDQQFLPGIPDEIEEQDQQFLPGIPDEITVKVIIPKFPWRALQILMCVSRVWKQAYESRQVYAARVHSLATERFDVTQKHLPYFGNRLVVRPRRDSLPYVLPSIPRTENRRPTHYIISSLDGKIYAAGGKHIQSLFVLDLAGQKQWKECASMQEPRESLGNFQCNVKDGKLYVWGGVTYLEKAPWARDGRWEVYDPIVDSWSFTDFDLRKCPNETWDESFLEV